jgi:3,4-dihydroxy 2-butanone 4-phosphate synthase/GTP cyclohydrolase II
VEANEALGFPPDLRDYAAGAQIIRDLGITAVHLLTNNPEKIKNLQSRGVNVVKRVPIVVPSNPDNRQYLETKIQKMGHLS